MPGGPETSCASGESLAFDDNSSFDSPGIACTEVPEVSASVLLGVLSAPRISLPRFLLTWIALMSVGLSFPDVDGRDDVDGREGGVSE